MAEPAPHSARAPSSATAALIALALVAAAGLGALLAIRLPLGFAAVAAIAYAAVVVRSPALGVALWLPAMSLTFLPPGKALLYAGFPAAALAVLLVAARLGAARMPAWRHGGWFAAIAILIAWADVSILWAGRPEMVVEEIWRALLAVFAGVAVVAVVTRREHALWMIAALVAGPVLSAGLGLVGGEAIDRYAAGETFGRLAGGSGDANQLAAGLVPAVALALGLLAVSARGWTRVLAIAALPVAGVGLIATESRGGMLALAVVLAGLPFALRSTRRIVPAGLVLAAVATVTFALLTPGSLVRLSDTKDGTGREELWRVAVHMAEDHPFGVGFNGFRTSSSQYALEPGQIEHLSQVVGRPIVVHNTYLQFLAELGIVGLLAFLAVVGLSLRSAHVAARRYLLAGDSGMAALSRAWMVALTGFLVASAFVSFGFSYRMWTLLAVGPALLTVASRLAGPATSADRAPAS